MPLLSDVVIFCSIIVPLNPTGQFSVCDAIALSERYVMDKTCSKQAESIGFY
jgi:hypothetical protein